MSESLFTYFKPKNNLLNLIKQNIPFASILEIISKDFFKYYSSKTSEYENLSEDYKNQIQMYFENKCNIFSDTMKTCYICDFLGENIYPNLQKLIQNDDLIFKYIMYPTFQVRTLLPFIDTILPINNLPSFYYDITSPVAKQFIGVSGKKLIGNLRMPIIRYGTHKGGAQVIKLKNKDFCGTFYYFEPSSEIFLTFNTVLIFPNKFKAWFYLSNKDVKQFITEMFENQNIQGSSQAFAYKKLSASLDIKFDYKEFISLNSLVNVNNINTNNFKIFQSININDFLNDVTLTYEEINFSEYNNVGNYVKSTDLIRTVTYKKQKIDPIIIDSVGIYFFYKLIEMMLTHDDFDWTINFLPGAFAFDQQLCEYCKQHNIDVMLCVTAFSEKERVITELLDSRSRDISYSSLRINNNPTILRRRDIEKKELDDIEKEDIDCGFSISTDF